MPKKANKKITRPSLFRRLLRYFWIIAFSLLGLAVTFIFLIKAGFFGELPSGEQLKNIQSNFATEVYSADRVLIGRYYIHERQPTSFEHISPHVINALVATEDARFYEHKGVDPRSLGRVIVKTLLMHDRSAGGGSTISQQLAKNIFPREINNKLDMAVAKIKEALTAYKLEKIYSKEEVLELYLNTVPFGENIYGIELAAERFFSKKAKDLSLSEAAVLVGMLKANHSYNPRLFPERSKQRRNVVLAQMMRNNYISHQEFDALKDLPIKLNYNRITPNKGMATYFRSFLKDELEKWAEDDGNGHNIYTDGLKIYTTIDSRIQQAAEAAMTRNMAVLQAQFDKHWSGTKPWNNKPAILNELIRNSDEYKKLYEEGLEHDQIIERMSEDRTVDLFTYDGIQSKNMSSIDSLSHYLMILQTGLVAIDPANGHIKAWVGGIDFEHFKYDHVVTAKRQVGSTFKPFVYAAALENGVEPCDYISASRTAYTNLDGWTPDNADSDENLMKYSFTGALAKSVNTVTIKLLENVGVEKVTSLAREMGIDENLPSVPSVGLGTASISLLEMTRAYCAFANGGKRIDPVFLTEIHSNDDDVLYKLKQPDAKQVIEPSTAELMNHMLKAVVHSGTASSTRWKYNLMNDVAGKTGTTQSNTDGWFIGYNPRLAVGVWVGADNPQIRFRSTALGSGANMALPIFVGMFKDMNADPTLVPIAQASFDPLDPHLAEKVACVHEKEDKNFIQKVLGIEKKDKAKEKEFGEKAEKKGLFKKIGDLFKKKD